MINQQLLALKSFVKYGSSWLGGPNSLYIYALKLAVQSIPCTKGGRSIVNISVRMVILLA